MRRGPGSPRAIRKRLPAAGAAFSFPGKCWRTSRGPLSCVYGRRRKRRLCVTNPSAFLNRVDVVAKPAVQYACTECGYASGRWFGKCPGCATFGSLVEEVVGQVRGAKAPPKPLLRLVDVSAEEPWASLRAPA